MSANIIKVKAPSLEINWKEHFICSALKRGFELSGIVGLYVYVLNNLDTIKRNEALEITTGKNTLVFEVDDNDNIHLITGWNGIRKSKEKREIEK